MHKIRKGWDKMVRFEKHPEQAQTPQELKEGLEIGGWNVACNLCEAIMWVTIDMHGNKHLMRQGSIPYEICPICSQIHEMAQS